MAGPKGSKYYDIFLKHQIQLISAGDIIIEEEGFILLREIEKEKSIVAAAKNMGISYRKAWGLLRDIESSLGFSLVGKRRGGKAGGRTTFTNEGKELLDAYTTLISDLESSDKDVIRTFFRRINDLKVIK
jgi:molybdate transport repressor ModE-like protein